MDSQTEYAISVQSCRQTQAGYIERRSDAVELITTPPIDPYSYGPKPKLMLKVFNFEQPVRIELYPDAAPITVAYFLKLVGEGFYNGLRFHRAVPGFLLQGGDPTGTGDGETEFYVKGEFANNGIDNPLHHERGTLSMARQEEYDSASCQFFILVNDVPSMDGDYAAFGKVTEGIELIEALSMLPTYANESPIAPVIIQSITVDGER